MTRAEKAAAKKVNARINRIYVERCANIQISIWDIPKVFAVGRQAIAAGDDDKGVGDNIASFVESIRKN